VDEVVVQRTGPHSLFADFLAALSTTMATVAGNDLDIKLARHLDQLALQLGVERCTVAEFSVDGNTAFHTKWLVGKDPTPFISPEDSWIRNRLARGQSVAISSLSELPAEAAATRQQLETIGIRSGLWVPMLAEGSAIGGVGLTVLSNEHDWPDSVVRRCKLISQVIGSAIHRRRSAGEIEEGLQFEALINDFSIRLLKVNADIDSVTDQVLGELGEFLGTDRIGYLEINIKDRSLVPTRQWFADGIEQDRSLQYVDVSARFPWLSAEIMGNRPVTINNTDQFPGEATNERQFCENLGIQSFTMVPAIIGDVTAGALSLGNIKAPRNWSDELVQRLQIVVRIIAIALDRQRRQSQIEQLRRFEHAISEVSTAFVNLPAEAVDDQIETGLGTVAESLNADLMALLRPHARAGFVPTHEWSSEEFAEFKFKGTEVNKVFPWLGGQLRQHLTVAVSTLSEFPEEATTERNAMEQAGLAAVLFVPFSVRSELAGYVAINTVRPTQWPDDLVTQVRLIGEVFGEALNRKQAELDLASAFTKIKALKERLQQENLYLREEARLTLKSGEIIGDSPALRAALTKVEQVATTDSTVLILGETGTGKELIARAIHNFSGRQDKVLVKVNCAALPSTLVEAELFGREKGAFTGALTREPGRFEVADGSTILLDEIGELSLELQAKLLRVLQDGEFERLGSSKTLRVDVRVLAATNRDLARAVEKKEFREDLYYRLNVFPIEVPPLRDRVEDIPKLVWAFVGEFSETMGKTIESIPVAAMDSLKQYSWPGNVREVRNVIERAMIVSNGPTLEIDLPKTAATAGSSKRLADVEREHIRAVVQATGWRIRGVGGAAEILGLKATTLEARMKKLGLKRNSTR
jgi:transcriptional regulator with GAF, ATPase, and Fis domain